MHDKFGHSHPHHLSQSPYAFPASDATDDLQFSIGWEQDYAERMNPSLWNRLLRQTVPVVEFVNFQIQEIGEGLCRSLLPLNYESTNQHGSHQGALISLAGDYTGGIAVASLLRGVPIASIHPGSEDRTAAIWLASMKVKYLAPSAGDLFVECQIESEDQRVIQRRYMQGRRVFADVKIEFSVEQERVATADMTYFVQPTIQLRPTADNPRVSTLGKHKLKASARMIAGLRAGLGGDTKIRADCPYSKIVAGPHGKLLARRLNEVLPELQDMVLARTNHVDATILEALRHGLKQVVLVGAGLDVRAYRYGVDALRATYFEVDLPEMLEERERVIAQLRGPLLKRRLVSMNFELQQLHEVLLKTNGFDPLLPTAFVYEGCSMYFDEPTNRRMLLSIQQLMRHSDSFLWVDYVGDAIVDGTLDHQGIKNFLMGMEELGESFVFGLEDPATYMRGLGFDEVEQVASSDFFETDDPVCSLYRFTVSRCRRRK